MLTVRQPVETDKLCFLHVGRELGYQRKGASMGLLCLGLWIGYMGGHSTLALATMPGVIDFVAEFAMLCIAVFSCHNDNDNGKVGGILSKHPF